MKGMTRTLNDVCK